MAKGRWKVSDEQVATEAYAVLIAGQKAGRSFTKPELRAAIAEPAVYVDFLKHCIEHDTSRDLLQLRKGLLQVARSVGVSRLSEQTGLSRLSLYRMLSRNGNPRLDSLLSLLRALRVHLWLVDETFVKTRQRLVRPKDIESARAGPKRIRKPSQ